MTSPVPSSRLSYSSPRALRWAYAATAHRVGMPSDSTPLAEPEDLLVGVLLAHPDKDGEGRVFLEHFGLTARDVLPASYPSISADDLARWARSVAGVREPPVSTSVVSVISAAQGLAKNGEV